MTHALDLALVLLVAAFAGTLSGIIGTGSSMILMPVLVACFGPKQAVPIMAIGAVMGNLGKMLAWRSHIDWRACSAWCATAVPGAILGVHALLALPARVVDVCLGLFFISMIPARRWLAHRAIRLSPIHLAILGAPIGFLTGIVVSTGPITVPVFTAYGLDRGAFLATEAAASLAVYLAKVATFEGLGALPLDLVAKGFVAGGALMAGSYFARNLVVRMSAETFRLIVDALMLVSGLCLLLMAFGDHVSVMDSR